MFQRPTSLAAAFVTAAAKQMHAGKVDHQSGQGNWVARRTILNTDRPGFGVVKEFDRRPVAPVRPINTGLKTLDTPTIKAIHSFIDDMVDLGQMQRMAPAAGLEDTEVVGID